MKNRKVLAFVMALAMIFTLIPASAFAASTNSVDAPKVVAADTVMPVVRLMLKMGEGGAMQGNTEQVFKLTLENATWAMGDKLVHPTAPSIFNGTPGAVAATDASIQVGVATGAATTSLAIQATSLNAITNTTAELRVETDFELKKDDMLYLYLCLKSGDEPGEIRITVDGLDSDFSSSTHVIGIVGSGNTTATVSGTLPSTWRTTGFTTAAIEIRENAVNSVTGSAQDLRLTLPTGMTWDGLTSSGALGDIIGVTPGSFGSRDLEIKVDPSGNPDVRDALWLTPVINIGKDAKMGDITVTIRNITTGINSSNRISNASGLVVGHYIEESVKVYSDKEADLPELIAGREDDTYEVVVYVEEVVDTALARDRYIDFEFPEYVQVIQNKPVDSERLLPGGDKPGSFASFKGDVTKDTSSFEFQLPDDINNKKDKFKFTIPVTIEPGTPSGDLTVTVKGAKAGLPDSEVVVGKILNPITAQVGITDIRAGIQRQSLNDIVIKENFAGALLDRNASNGTTAKLELAMTSDLNAAAFKGGTATLVSGDGELGKVDVSSGIITVEIKSQSVKEPMEIKISDVVLTVDRTPAEGKYNVAIYGDALVTNSKYVTKYTHEYRDDDFNNSAVNTPYVNVITLADANLYGQAKFVIGEAKYEVYVNGVLETNEMDTAPYIDTANRTQVPVRFAANALGVSDDSIIWDQASKSVTIFKGDRVIVFTVGSNKINVNGATITMDTTMVNNNGRTFVPIAHLSNALGATYIWDAAEKSVTITRATN